VGTIAKALKKHKVELAGSAKAKPEAEPWLQPGVHAHPAHPPASLETGAEKVSDSLAASAQEVQAERPSYDVKKQEPAADLFAGSSKDSDARPHAGSKEVWEKLPASIIAAGKPLPQKTELQRESISPEATKTTFPPAMDDDRGTSATAFTEVGPAPLGARHEPSHAPATAIGKVDPSLVSLLDPDGFEADLFRLLRTRILFPQAGQPPRTILVTSALAEEGKSFIAANLAINIARHVDQHVLLVDCDLRKPSIHTKFGLNGVKGLSEYLAAGLDLPALLLKSGVEKLTILPSGRPPQNPSELITSAKMAALIQELRARYHDRYIILDSPPPMMAPETSAIAKWVDGILLVVKYASTPMDMVEELMAHLDREKIIGAVINKFNLREFRRYSYNKYYNKYKSYQKLPKVH
jgi:exopolysaccharide/PEP-CTERM locus tyrosine autokinase